MWREKKYQGGHVNPSFLTGDKIELQSNFNLQVSFVYTRSEPIKGIAPPPFGIPAVSRIQT